MGRKSLGRQLRRKIERDQKAKKNTTQKQKTCNMSLLPDLGKFVYDHIEDQSIHITVYSNLVMIKQGSIYSISFSTNFCSISPPIFPVKACMGTIELENFTEFEAKQIASELRSEGLHLKANPKRRYFAPKTSEWVTPLVLA